MNRILMVCTGNICRSPMAEELLRQRLLVKERPIEVSSAGTHAVVGAPADPMADELLLHQCGITISKHRARQLTQELIFSVDLILTMDIQQQRHIEHTFSGVKGRVYRIGALGSFDVPDPYKRPRAIFEHALALIEQGIDEWQQKLWT